MNAHAEWQAPSNSGALIWSNGADASFWIESIALVAVAAAMVLAYFRLAHVTVVSGETL
jgi:hypothetical protein